MTRSRRAWLAAWPAWAALLSACAAAPGPAAGGAREWRGQLSRKGSPPGLFWALLDDAGREWRLAPAAAWEARLQALQGRRVLLTGQLSGDPQGDEIALIAVAAL